MVAMIGFGYLAGYDLVTSILPDHLIWGSIGLTIGMALIQVFLTLIRPGHISITILKSVLILVLFALALSNYFYLGYTGEHAQEFFIVAAISYTIFFIVSAVYKIHKKTIQAVHHSKNYVKPVIFTHKIRKFRKFDYICTLFLGKESTGNIH